MRDRANQITLGVFVSTFLYCLLVLRTIQSNGDADFIPHFSVLIGVGFAIASIGVLIHFIHHIADSIHVSSAMSRVGNELLATLDSLFPEQLGHRPAEDALSDDALRAELNRTVAIGSRRTPEQDIRFLVEQLTDMAGRALSPGINDPYTAAACVNWLGAAVASLARRAPVSPYRHDAAGQLRIVAPVLGFEEFCAEIFGALLSYIETNRVAAERTMTTLHDVYRDTGERAVAPSLPTTRRSSCRGSSAGWPIRRHRGRARSLCVFRNDGSAARRAVKAREPAARSCRRRREPG